MTTLKRHVHHAADREIRSGNIAPFASRKLWVSLALRLCLRTSREAGLLRLAIAVVALAASWTGGYVVLVLVGVPALVALVASWRSLLARKPWEDPSIVHVNRLVTHSRLGNYTTFDAAAARGQSPNVVSLSGTWKFALASAVAKTPAGFQHPEFQDGSWDDINVPGHWQLQHAGGRDPPIYTNTNYPFPNHPPYAPRKNPTGLYRRKFSLPAEWLTAGGDGGGGVDEVLNERFQLVERPVGARLRGRVVICFQGVDSAFHVWVNGRPVGFAKGSRLPCEFDVTDAVRGTGEQSLCLRVVRWSDGSYLEDQDHWWLSGVYREVELVLRPGPSRISDFVVRPFLREDDAGGHTRGSLEVEVLVERDAPPPAHASASTGWRNRGVATLGEGDTSEGNTKRPALRRRASFPLENVEAGEGRGLCDDGPRSALGTGEINCSLLDTATGEKMPLELAGALPDWQMGLPPGDARQEQRQQQSQWGSELSDDSGNGGGVGGSGVGDVGGVGDGGGGCVGRFLSGIGRRCGVLGGSDEGTAVGKGATPASPATRRSVRLFRLEVPGAVRAWSAEDPQLYTLVVSLRGEEAQEEEGEEEEEGCLQFESARVGFRSVRVASGQLLVNGSAVMLAGANRHEHDPDTGKSVSEESMRRDIVMMKRFNFNAVRNCHYPNHWRWYELCDELGLYVCDEANIESHGQIPLCRLSADPYWRLAYLDRTWRMLAANKNHACIVLWSLGNESGDGGNLSACRELIKAVEPSRPVVYEGGGGSLVEGCGCTELTDVVFPMYATVDATEVLGTDGPDGLGETRPCVLCEYSHAMGNSNGNLHKYWEIFRGHRRLQGGFIWDWVDQGLTQYDLPTGRKYWTDGRGFAGRHSEGYDAFCVNGITFPDRSPHPALWEAKFLAQPVGIELIHRRCRDDRSPSSPPPSSPSPSSGRLSSGAPYSGEPCSEEPLKGDPLKGEPLQGESLSGEPLTGEPLSGDYLEGEPLKGPVPISVDKSAATAAAADATAVTLIFTNRYAFLLLDHLSIAWRLQSSAAAGAGSAGSSLASGEVQLLGLAPATSREVGIDAFVGLGGCCSLGGDRGGGGGGGSGGGGGDGGVGDGRGLRDRGEFFVHVEARLRDGSAWAPAGHLVAWGCFPVTDVMPAGKTPQALPLALLQQPLPGRSSTTAQEGFPALSGGKGGPGVGEAVTTTGAVPRSPLTLVVYEDDGDSSAPSGEGSPMGQLREQLLVDSPTRPPTSSLIVVKGLLDRRRGVVRVGVGVGVGGSASGAAQCPPTEWMLIVSKIEGTIVRFVAGGLDLIEPGTGPSICLWRAATDNDKAGWATLLNFVIDSRVAAFLSNFLPLSRLSHLQRWKASGLCASDPPLLESQSVVVDSPSDQECVIRVKSRCLARRRRRVLFRVTTEVKVSAGGRLEITTDVEPARRALHNCLSLARVGMVLKLPPGFGHVEWFGKGPFECYQDRKHGATTDVFSGTVEGQHVPYITPSENGGKADVRWMALRRGEGGAGVLLKSEKGAVFEAASCSLYSAAELQEAERTVDLPLRTSAEDPVYVYLDRRSMGVGGDNSWFPDVVHSEYTVSAKKMYRFRVSLEALGPGQSAPLAALAPSEESVDR